MNIEACCVLVEPDVVAVERLCLGEAVSSREYRATSLLADEVAGSADGSRQDPMPVGESEDHSVKPVRILLADDHAIVRDSLARLLQMQKGLEVVGRASDGQEAVDLALKLKPDVIVMDVTMPRLNGIQATHRIKRIMPDVQVIGLSMHEEADMALAMKTAGAVHYLPKTSSPGELVSMIRACSRDGQ